MSKFKKNIKLKGLNSNYIKIVVLSTIALFSNFHSNQLHAQSNPGFMGKTKLIDFYVLSDWGRVVSYSPKINLSYGLQVEIARKRNFGVTAGVRTSQLKYRATGYEPSFSIITSNGDYQDIEVVDYDDNSPENDYLKYSANELFVQFKQYRNSKGSLAPYGSYWGLELSGVQFTPTENRIRYQTYDWLTGTEMVKISVSNNPVLAFVPSIIFGKRTMLTDEVSFNYFGSVGAVFFHNSNAEVFNATVTSAKEAIDYMMLNEMAISRLFSVGVSVGYLF